MNRRLLHVATMLSVFAFLGLAGASPGQAQVRAASPEWTFDGRGGLSAPNGDFADLPIEVGPNFGAGVGYHVTPRVVLRADGSVELFSGEDLAAGGTGPDVSLWHYNAGVEVELTRPGADRWDVTANLAGGATTWDTDAFATGTGATRELSETYFTANGGLRAGYDVARTVNVFVGGQWYLQFTDEEDTRALADLSADLTEGFDTASTVPLYAGIEFEL